MELAACVRHAANLRHAELEVSLLVAELVAHELAAPALLTWQAEEGPCMLAAAAIGEVENDGLDRVELRRAIAPQVGAVRLAVPRLEHRHRCLVGASVRDRGGGVHRAWRLA